jgi:hypothetical protein
MQEVEASGQKRRSLAADPTFAQFGPGAPQQLWIGNPPKKVHNCAAFELLL